MQSFVGAVGTLMVGALAAGCGAAESSLSTRHFPMSTARIVPVVSAIAEAPAPPPPVSGERALPAFPAGWILGAAAAPLDPPPRLSPRSLEALAIQRSPPRRRVPAPNLLRIAELPIIEVSPRIDWSKEPTAPPSTDEAADLFFDWPLPGGREGALAAGAGASISVRGQRFGFFDLNFYSSFTVPGKAGGHGVSCGQLGGTGYRSASWQSLRREGDAEVRLVGAEAWFDYHTCTAYVMRRIEGLASPIAAGLAYAFRTRCPRCEIPGDELHVILPEQGWSRENRQHGFQTERSGSPYAHVYISLAPGAAGSLVAHFRGSVMDRWRSLGAPVSARGNVVFGLEVSRAATEAEPTAIYYSMDGLPE